MIAKQLDQITEDDLQRLIGTSEDRQSEFKASLGRSDDEVKEFLKDVSAMANAIGGDIIYGIVEGVNGDENTVAQVIQGISGQNSDDEILRLDNLIRDCIKPRLIGIGIRALQLSNNNTAFIVRVPRSWNAPHLVDRRGHWRFYYRDSAGTHPITSEYLLLRLFHYEILVCIQLAGYSNCKLEDHRNLSAIQTRFHRME